MLDGVDAWKLDVYNKLMEEKGRKIRDEEQERKDEIANNHDVYVAEAERLLKDIAVYDAEDKWQYRKGLRLMYLGNILETPHYKDEGYMFHKLATEKASEARNANANYLPHK